ncbi:unnamed protein product [Phytomonas sp. Hart1]|nr:unnamed protein product [Phytomonas sp. Hart1]|eukprot:CCW66992.1 unnamed protein product [Phytomonas sp. isolate Hart1]
MRHVLCFTPRQWKGGVVRGITAGFLPRRFITSSTKEGSSDKNATYPSKEGNATSTRNQTQHRLPQKGQNFSKYHMMQKAPQRDFSESNTNRPTSGKITPSLQRAKSRLKHSSSAKGFVKTTHGEPAPSFFDTSIHERQMDVEKGFPTAMAHLKSVLVLPYAQQGKEDRKWSRVTHAYNMDGYPLPQNETTEPSFFDQDSLDIRNSMRDAAMRTNGAHPTGMTMPSSSPPTTEEVLSPDVLQLTGGQPRQDGLGLSLRSNLAPADQTVEGDDSINDFGDTPVQITDMLRERLMELKAEKLQEDRDETFLPRRMRLESDVELQRRQQRNHRQEDFQVLSKASKNKHPFVSSSVPTPPKRVLTLSDLEKMEEANGTGISNNGMALTVSSSLDSVSNEQRQQAARFLRHADEYLPGANTNSHNLNSKPLTDNSFTGHQLSDSSLVNPHGVYLLRVLSRASYCSRREASAIISSGQVRVNNVVERNPFRLIRPEDDVHVLGHDSRLRYAPPRLWMYHKPANVSVSRNDVSSRALISKHTRILGMDHLIPVGSLPLRAHGILMLTNDGELSRFLENPKSNIQQTYLLRVRPAIDPILAHKLNTEGININGKQFRNVEFLVNPSAKSRHSVKIKIRGETMHVSQLMQHLGRMIERGGRISFGPFSLSTLPVGSMREVTVPLFYAHHLGAVWKPFVERDWPYFRRQRVTRLRQLARYRELTPKEVEELEQYTYEEVHHALSFESQELSDAVEKRAKLIRHHLELESDKAFERNFTESTDYGDWSSVDPGYVTENYILHDITAAT